MNQSEAQAYLEANYAELLAVAGTQVLTDALASFVAFTTSRPDVHPSWHASIASYSLLVRLQNAFATGMDVTIEGEGSFSRSQRYKQVTDLLRPIAARVAGIIEPGSGDPVADANGRTETLTLSWLANSERGGDW